MPNVRRLAIAAVAGAVTALAVLVVWAPAAGAEPTHVRVSTYLMGIGKPDIGTGGYTADFYLVMRCDRPCDASSFELRNGKITSVDKQEDTPTRQVFRVTASLTAPLELRRYPFDRHVLSIQLEDRLHPTSQLVYVADNAHNGIDPAVQVPGWELDRGSLHASVGRHHYPIFDPPDDEYSLYAYEMEIGRAPLSSFMKVLFPGFAIMASAFLGLMVKPDKALNRLGIHTGALTAAILFHLNVTAGIPPTGYLVDADKFMIANYTGLVGAVISTVLIMVRFDGGAIERSQHTYRRAAFAIPAIWLVAQAMVWLT